MIELKTAYTFSGIPYITNKALDNYAQEIVADFRPESLEVPGPLDAEVWVTKYLGLAIQYLNILDVYGVHAMIAFNDGVIQAVNENTGQEESIPVPAGTIIIDPSITLHYKQNRLRFTLAHEGAHWLLHKKAFSVDNPFGQANIYENQLLAAKVERTDCKHRHKIGSDTDCIERQADFLASAILMPRSALRIIFKNFLAAFGEKPRKLVRGINSSDDYLVSYLTTYTANTFHVSIRAARIRLDKLETIW